MQLTYQYSKDDGTHCYLCSCGRYVVGLPEHFKGAISCGSMPADHNRWLIHAADEVQRLLREKP